MLFLCRSFQLLRKSRTVWGGQPGTEARSLGAAASLGRRTLGGPGSTGARKEAGSFRVTLCQGVGVSIPHSNGHVLKNGCEILRGKESQMGPGEEWVVEIHCMFIDAYL